MKLDVVLFPLSRDEHTDELRLSADLWRAVVELSSRSGFTLETRLSGPDGRHAARALQRGLRQLDAPLKAPSAGRGSARFSTAHLSPAQTYPYRVFTDVVTKERLQAVIALLEQGRGLLETQRVPR